MDLFVNGEKIDAQIENEKTVGEVLTSFEITCENNDAAVIGICVDGKQITADIFDETSLQELREDTRFDFSIVTINQIKEAFEKLSILFTKLSEKMESIPVILQNGQNKEAAESIKCLADSIDQFCHIAALASLFPETFTNTCIDGKNFNDFFANFSPVLLDFEEALKTNDTVMIGDLSEYEICPRLKSISESLKQL